MPAAEIDAYLAGLGEPDRSALESLRTMILDVVPDAEQCISYGLPAFRVEGVVVAGFGAFAKHLSYLPHSGSVLKEVGDRLSGTARPSPRSTSPRSTRSPRTWSPASSGPSWRRPGSAEPARRGILVPCVSPNPSSPPR